MIEIQVPSIVCEGCGSAIAKAIESKQSDAKVSVDLDNKTVTVETTASEAELKSIIVAVGHTPA
ncbi:Heavy metal transport/detoxification protein [[Leptolyngbya] sp. PCC 7376]|uniref:heavy-metal-associated domain-containing protein n=1 Tax=[Leptolyngbya] sp. PCC 7376 TaxID=111781 RepID=UPI00029EFC35|nr:heavy-metal-associated domain-containing protein [[Leptolyngbya] sp. PCC 7376]AFY38460.1 Heavy metal transport/detoxification protein [[Leptolyngbya] sp. PCC 7376]